MESANRISPHEAVWDWLLACPHIQDLFFTFSTAENGATALVPLTTCTDAAEQEFVDGSSIRNYDFTILRFAAYSTAPNDAANICLLYTSREYRLTRPMLGLSAEMWRQPFEGGESGVERARRTVQDGDDPFIPIEGAYDETKAPWLVYAPAIRNEAMYDRLEHLFAMLEKAVGTSRGILTARETATATATEIRAANHDTLTLVTAIRRMWEQALDDMAYAADVLLSLIHI